jgi:hypothetical protein
MAPQNRKEELLAAWRALAGNAVQEGWRTIQIGHTCKCRVLAGRHFPGNEEALLVGFASVHVPPADQLPQGRGFLVSRGKLGADMAGCTWVTLRRQNAGSLELFSMMSDDVLTTIEGLGSAGDDRLFNAFIARIRAWQEFMKKSGDGVLGTEAETGLFGELDILQEMMSAGVPCLSAVEAWQGPLEGLHDFAYGTGAIEVKTTASSNGFPVTIGSLEQLDNSLVRPIYLAAVRLVQNVSGQTLPEKIGSLRDMVNDDPVALATLNSRLLHGGFIDALADRYTRRFSRVTQRVIEISGDFPRLTRENVAIQIRKVRYEVDLDLVQTVDTELAQALRELGVIA